MAQDVKLFAEVEFSGVSDGVLRAVAEQINGENTDYLLNVNKTEYIQHLLEKYQFESIEILFDQLEASPVERSVLAEHFPSQRFFVEPGQRYTKPAFIYHLPFKGDAALLRYIPNPRIMMTYKVQVVAAGEISFEIIDFNGTPETVKREADSILNYIREQSAHLISNVRHFNQALPATIGRLFDERKAKLLQQGQLAASLGVPIRRNANVPATFAVPASIRRVAIPRPVRSVGVFRPDPTIDQGIYTEILETIQNTGQMFERLPSVYSGKNEEALRDHLLMTLEPRFQITSIGETFNKSGKTDILMRHEGKNVFVAECKFWGGGKKHFETIDQILGYLTFRDSKTAIIYFIDTKEMTAPLKAVEEATPNHPEYVASKGRREDTWFNYEFRLPGDPGRNVQLAILCFHLPK